MSGMCREFQFHKVRLKVPSSLFITTIVSVFQFHKVRLKVRLILTVNKLSQQFQFHKVRLKVNCQRILCGRNLVSIPQGTIKRARQQRSVSVGYTFQFHKVRLKDYL